MKILLFSPFHSTLGGMEQASQNLARKFVALDHQALVITTPEHARTAPPIRGVEVHGVPLAKIPRRLRRVSRLGRYLRYFPASARSVRTIVVSERPDIVLMICQRDRGVYAACFPGAVVTATLQNSTPAITAFDLWNLRRWLGRCEWIFAASEHTLKNTIQEVPGIQRRCESVPNGIDLELFEIDAPPREPGPYILFLGRMVFQKGADILIEAFHKIEKKIPNIHLLMAGDGEDLERLQSQALNPNGRIFFHGAAKRDVVPSLIRNSLFLVVPSRFEPLGIVNIEAMASGKAVVASRVGGIPEIVTEGETGLLVPPEDPDALAEALLRLAQDSSLRESMGRKGKIRATADFSWDTIAKRYLDRFESILNSRSIAH